MMGMLPYGYGESLPATPLTTVGTSSEDKQAATAIMVAQIIGAAASGAVSTPEEIQARIENLQGMKKRIPALSAYYDNQINKLRARQRALVQSQQKTDTWRGLGQAGLVVGILVGVGLFGLTLRYALK
jgi:hypothetical protein